jgi:hypothetical protein
MIDYLCGGEIFDAVRWAGMGKYQVVFLVQVVKASPFILEGRTHGKFSSLNLKIRRQMPLWMPPLYLKSRHCFFLYRSLLLNTNRACDRLEI